VARVVSNLKLVGTGRLNAHVTPDPSSDRADTNSSVLDLEPSYLQQPQNT